MPFGRGFGRGFGRRFGRWAYGPYAYGGYGTYPAWGWGGRGSPFPYYGISPWFPQWSAVPNAGQYAAVPYYGYRFPDYATGYPYAYSGFAPIEYPWF